MTTDGEAESYPLHFLISPETLEALPFAACVYDAHEILVAANAKEEELMGIPIKNFVGTLRVSDFEADPRAKAAVDAVRSALAGVSVKTPAIPSDLRMIEPFAEHAPPQPMWFDAMTFPLRDPTGRVRFAMMVNTDQTALVHERMAVEQAKAEIASQRETIEALRAAKHQIASQRETILALSAPIMEVWRGILALPVIGHVDHARAQDMTIRLLEAIVRTQSTLAMLDLTGVQQVDAQTADSFMAIVRAVELLGAEAILVGIQPLISTSIVELNMDLGKIRSFRTLGAALEVCTRELARGKVGQRRIDRTHR